MTFAVLVIWLVGAAVTKYSLEQMAFLAPIAVVVVGAQIGLVMLWVKIIRQSRRRPPGAETRRCCLSPAKPAYSVGGRQDARSAERATNPEPAARLPPGSGASRQLAQDPAFVVCALRPRLERDPAGEDRRRAPAGGAPRRRPSPGARPRPPLVGAAGAEEVGELEHERDEVDRDQERAGRTRRTSSRPGSPSRPARAPPGGRGSRGRP